jgi:7,8-dihydropterin-6-yl-methyl-4-(beta-D-ribofuranosyl)aminobenzene 5'-phosphate synthase
MPLKARDSIVNRRLFLQGSALAALAGIALPACAWTKELATPEVDSLTLEVLVDNATFGPFLPDLTLPGLQVVRNNGSSEQGVMPRSPLQAEFGLSILAQSRRGQQSRRVLVDFGYSPEVLAHNAALLGVDPDQISAAVLSHGHLDHYGGFAGVFRNAARRDRHVPLFVGGEEVFCERLAMIGNPPPLMGALDRKQLAIAGFDVRMAPEATIVADHAFTTGIIPLHGFERAAIPTQMRPGVGCDADKLSPAKRTQKQLPDDGEHELATVYNVRNLGLVVIASCSHRGVLNSIRQAQEVSGVSKIHAVVGGFHLVRPRTEAEARQTVAEMAAINPMYIVPMHCTGEVFIEEALRVLPTKVVRPYVGTKLTFSA